MMGSADGQYRTGELTTPMGTAAKFFADAITGKSDTARDYARHLVRPCLFCFNNLEADFLKIVQI